MTLDEGLVARLRSLTAQEPGLTEKRMFGGVAFLVNGNMAVAASGQGGMMLRSDPARAEELVDGRLVERMVMKGRPMNGWLLVHAEQLDDEQLDPWVSIGLDFARQLPAK